MMEPHGSFSEYLDSLTAILAALRWMFTLVSPLFG
jgi:hypothetical protein